MSTLTEFLLARFTEDGTCPACKHPVDEHHGRWCRVPTGAINAAGQPRICCCEAVDRDIRLLADIASKSRIVEWHQNWPVFVEGPTEFEPAPTAQTGHVDPLMMRASKQLAWLTEQEYQTRFGDEPPTGPILRLLALPYVDHPDYDEAWRI